MPSHLFVLRTVPGAVANSTIDWLASTLSRPGEAFDAMGIAIDGGTCRINGSKQEWSLVEEGPEGPNTLVPLIVSRRIGESIVATGMQRRVYAGGANGWYRVDNGVRIPPNDVAIGGFLSIDGTSPEQLWAAGYYGEIWQRDQSHWKGHRQPHEFETHRTATA